MMAKCRITSSTRSNAPSNLLSRKGAKLSAMPQTTPFTMQPMNKNVFAIMEISIHNQVQKRWSLEWNRANFLPYFSSLFAMQRFEYFLHETPARWRCRRGLPGAARRKPGALFRLRSAHALFRRHQPPAPCGAVDDCPAATRHFVGQVLRAFRAVLVRPHLPPVWLRLHGQRLHKGQNWRAQFGSGSGRRGNNLAGHAWLQFGVSSGKKPPEAE